MTPADGEPREPSEICEEPHDWYGPCDGMGPKGECSECGKAQFSTREEWEIWLRSDDPPTEAELLQQQIEALTAALASVTAEKEQLAKERAEMSEVTDRGGRLLLNAYGRRCYDAGRDALAQQLAQVQQELKAATSTPERDWEILLSDFSGKGEALPERKIAAFLRVYARRIRANERWDINETMANAYECAARRLEADAEQRARADAAEAALTDYKAAWENALATEQAAVARLNDVQCQANQAEAALTDLREKIKALPRKDGPSARDGWRTYVIRADDLDAILAASAGEQEKGTAS